jgi:ribosomal protein S18 acetylase RimI-like enzyme
VSANSLALSVEPLSTGDVVAVAQCIALDADAFPYASASFGLRDSSARAWVARDVRSNAGSCPVVGFIAGHVRQGTLHVEGLAVDPSVRRQGVGRTLVREAAEGARAEGMRAVSLHVSVTNREAIALYRAEGFSVRARLRGFYPPAAYDGKGDAYQMRLPV